MFSTNWEQVNPIDAVEFIFTLKKNPVATRQPTDNYFPEFDLIFEEALDDLDRKERRLKLR